MSEDQMKQEEAKSKVVDAYKNEYAPTAKEGFLTDPMTPVEFYAWLGKNRPDCLAFDYSGDKYQIVKTWIKFS